MVSDRKLIRRFLLVGLMVGAGWAQTATIGRSGTETQASGNRIHLLLSISTPLSDVLREVCAQADVVCTGLELLPAEIVAPMVLDGSFLPIAHQLIEGTEVNLEYTRGTIRLRPRMTLTSKSQAVGAPEHAVGGATDDRVAEQPASPAPLSSRPLDDRLPMATSAGEATPANPTAVSSTAASVEQIETLGQAMKIYAGGYSMTATPSEFVPFPGPNGQPILAKPVNAEYLPFPDQFGNLVPIKPAKPGSPFPMYSDTQQAQK